MKRMWLGLAAMIATGIVIYTTTTGSAPAGAANLWINTTTGACQRYSTPVTFSQAQSEGHLCSLSGASNLCQNGDTVRVKGGTYSGSSLVFGWNSRTDYCNVYPTQGESVTFDRIVLGSWNGGEPISPGPCASVGANNSNSNRWLFFHGPMKIGAFWLNCAQNIKADGIDFDLSIGPRSTCTGDNGTATCTLQPMDWGDGNPSNITISNSTIHDAINPNAMVIISGSGTTFDGVTIRNNNNYSYGDPPGDPLTNNANIHDECIRAQGTTSNVTLKRVKVYNCFVYDIFLTAGTSTTGWLIENSFFGRSCNDNPVNGCASIRSDALSAHCCADGSSTVPNNWTWRYNTIRTPFAWSNGDGTGHVYKGNVFLGGSPSCSSGTFSYNAWETSGACSGTANTNGSFLSSCFVTNNDWSGTTGGDWHLTTGCSLIGAGDTGDFPTTDVEGNARSSPPNKGAYNNQGS